MGDNWIYEICEELYELHALCPDKKIYDIALELCDAYNIHKGYASIICAKFNEIEW